MEGLIVFSMLTIFIACNNKTHVIDRKTMEGKNGEMKVEVLRKKQQDGILSIKATYSLRKELFEQNKELSVQLQYKLDSSFYLLQNKDTIWPAFVLPIANGQLLTPQYIIDFDQAAIKKRCTTAFKTTLGNDSLFNTSVFINITNQPALAN